MIGMELKAAKEGFFDREAVTKKLDAKTRRWLSRFGSFVRRRDQTSQRRRKGVSPPGKPPYAHTGLIRDNTFFVYEESFARKGVVVGPILLRRGGKGILEALEEGGETTRRRKGRDVKETVQARPHTGPAFQTELAKLPGLMGR